MGWTEVLGRILVRRRVKEGKRSEMMAIRVVVGRGGDGVGGGGGGIREKSNMKKKRGEEQEEGKNQ